MGALLIQQNIFTFNISVGKTNVMHVSVGITYFLNK